MKNEKINVFLSKRTNLKLGGNKKYTGTCIKRKNNKEFSLNKKTKQTKHYCIYPPS